MGKHQKRNAVIAVVICGLVLGSSRVFAQPVPDTPEFDAYIRQGWSDVEAGDLDRAMESFQKGADLDPENIRALEGSAWCYLHTDRLKEAEELYLKILAAAPGHVAARLGLANVYSWGGRHEESIGQYEKVLAQDSRDVRAYKGMAEVYGWDNRLKESVAAYQEALKLAGDDIELRLGLGKIYGWMGEWSKAEGEYEKILKIDPRQGGALQGIDEARAARRSYSKFRFQYTDETDALDFKARTFSYGYLWTQPLDAGNEAFAAYYFDDFRETGKTDASGHLVKMGGRLKATDRIVLSGSTDLRSYSPAPDLFAGGSLDMVLQYHRKDTFTLKYDRELFDVLDEVRGSRYGGESKIYLHERLVMTNAYSFGSYSDGNRSEDWYHNLGVILFKKKPDFSLSVGYRRRGFKDDAPQYYSPLDLDSVIYSAYLGVPVGKMYAYGNIKAMDNSDQIDNYYFLGGIEYRFHQTASMITQVSYFDTTEDYNALTATTALRAAF